ncbi:MAG: CinA family protein [Planctomycetaceae bacterium]|nr:CinA family protein [Planctomycetaceae bacterium]
MTTPPNIHEPAARLAALLRASGRRLVLAESCTAGLVAATLARIPGISEHLCGSAVVYRNGVKSAWLGIDPAVLDDPDIGPVSAECTRELALAVLRQTPEADISAAVTGHLGPNSPAGLDGVVYVAIAIRDPDPQIVSESCRVLLAFDSDPATSRVLRQQAAVEIVLNEVIDLPTPSGRGVGGESDRSTMSPAP